MAQKVVAQLVGEREAPPHRRVLAGDQSDVPARQLDVGTGQPLAELRDHNNQVKVRFTMHSSGMSSGTLVCARAFSAAAVARSLLSSFSASLSLTAASVHCGANGLARREQSAPAQPAYHFQL